MWHSIGLYLYSLSSKKIQNEKEKKYPSVSMVAHTSYAKRQCKAFFLTIMESSHKGKIQAVFILTSKR